MTFRHYPFSKQSKKSPISKTAEREFEREIRKLEQLEENAKKIHNDMQTCIEAQTAAQSKYENQMLLNLTASSLYRNDEKLQGLVDHWVQSTKKLELLVEELNATSQKVIIEPMKKIATIFPSILQAVKKRDQSLQEYSKCQEKVNKYVKRERTAQNVVKLENSRQACSIARTDFESQNNLLMDEIARLYDGRIMYIQPSLEALVKAQVKYYTDSQNTYRDLCNRLHIASSSPSPSPPPSPSSPIQNSAELKQSIKEKLAEIRALSITVNDQGKLVK